MSKVFNMVGGGGGKNISSIIITGLESTDTVTCIKDGKSYTATWDSTAQHWEIVGLPLGTFTVTATNGTKTKTETVLIDISGVYEIEMTFKLWLYRDGDECEDVTGGWKLESSITTMTKENDSIKIAYKTQASYGAYSHTIANNAIDFTNASSIHMKATISATGSTTEMQFFAVVDNTKTGMGFSTEPEHEFTCDVSSFSGYHMLKIMTDSAANIGNTTFYIYEIWLV